MVRTIAGGAKVTTKTDLGVVKRLVWKFVSVIICSESDEREHKVFHGWRRKCHVIFVVTKQVSSAQWCV